MEQLYYVPKEVTSRPKPELRLSLRAGEESVRTTQVIAWVADRHIEKATGIGVVLEASYV